MSAMNAQLAPVAPFLAGIEEKKKERKKDRKRERERERMNA